MKNAKTVKRPYKKAPRKTYGKKPVRLSTAVKKYVKSTIHKNIENKTNQTLSSGNPISSYSVNTSLFVVSMIPYSAIAQGLGQGDRIGNTITSRTCNFNFCLRPAPYSPTYNPIPTPQIVMIYFGKVKVAPPLVPNSADFAKLFQSGDTSHAPYSNTLDLLQNVNKDYFTVVKTLKFKIGFAQSNVQGGNSAYQFYQNNDYAFNIVRRINLTKYIPKILKFNDTTGIVQNAGLFMWAMCVPADGSTGTNAIPTYMDYTLNYTYEDA